MTDVPENTCPACGRWIDPDEQGNLPLQCPHCGQLLIRDDTEAQQQAQLAAKARKMNWRSWRSAGS